MKLKREDITMEWFHGRINKLIHRNNLGFITVALVLGGILFNGLIAAFMLLPVYIVGFAAWGLAKTSSYFQNWRDERRNMKAFYAAVQAERKLKTTPIRSSD
ncbi:MAG: hypothetical protein CL759_09205 [Chloroflexi bacterium]|nr:hypothetical protein [Chloroflexota bacterium]|tara:strand:+ start:2546 stop:2851 length:306 start_codon:yes stop_codon:yes gene_type:complete